MPNKNKRITVADLPPRYQRQVAEQLGTPVGATSDHPEGPARPAPKRRLVQSQKPLLNKLETDFHEHLQKTIPADAIFAQAVRLELARGHWYKPDFFVPHTEVGSAGTFYEVKGPHSFRGGFENLKVAARRFPHFKFLLVWREGSKFKGATWHEQHVIP